MTNSFLNGAIELYVFTDNKWKMSADNGKQKALKESERKKDTFTSKAIESYGAREGDWLIRRRNSKDVLIPRVETDKVNALYAYYGDRWHHMIWMKMKKGPKHSDGITRKLLSDLPIKDIPSISIAFVNRDEHGRDLVTIYRPDGKIYEVVEEYFYEFKQANEGLEYADDTVFAKADQSKKDAAFLKEITAESDKYLKVLQSQKARSLFANYIGWENDDAKKEKVGKALLELVEETAPGPAASGVTGVSDTVHHFKNMESDFRGSESTSWEQLEGSDAKWAQAGVGFNALQTLGALVVMGHEARNMYKLEDKAPGTKTGRKEFVGSLNTSHTNAQLANIKFAMAAAASLKVVADLGSNPAFAQAMQGVQKATGPAGAVLGALVVMRHTRKAYKAKERQKALKKIMGTIDKSDEAVALKRATSFLIHKLGRRKGTQTATVAVAGISTTGGVFLLIGAGAANAWNPVGWVILSGAVVGGLGLTGVRIYRRYYMEDRHERRMKKGNNANVVDAKSAGLKLIEIYRNDKLASGLRESAGHVLEAFGVVLSDLKTPNGRMASVALLDRHATTS